MSISDSNKLNFTSPKDSQKDISNEKNEKDECLTKFKEKTNKTSAEWKEAFNEYVDCKYKMFNKLKERKEKEMIYYNLVLFSVVR